MKVFFISDYFRPGIGGLENSIVYLAKALNRYFPVEVLTLASGEDYSEPDSISVRRFGGDGAPPYNSMYDVVRQEASQGNVAVCFFGFSRLWTDEHLKLVENVRDYVDKIVFKVPSLNEYSYYVNNNVRRNRLSCVDYLIALNPAIKNELLSDGILDRQILCLTNGISCDYYSRCSDKHKRQLRLRLGIQGQRVFIFPGRFARRKRVDMLVEAFLEVPEVNLLLVGYFDARFDKGYLFEVPSNRNIQLFNATPDILPFLHAADVYVSASVSEGMPNSLLEALATGLPALVSNIPGHDDVVNQNNGRLFNVNCHKDLITNIRWYISNWHLLGRLSAGARQTATSNYNIDCVARTYRNILYDG